LLFDRRGRARGGDCRIPRSLEREVQDTEAMLALAGQRAVLVGRSVGGAVALETAPRAATGALSALTV
jgi:pimeloyl-ACP methyl ester carboxylesterase